MALTSAFANECAKRTLSKQLKLGTILRTEDRDVTLLITSRRPVSGVRDDGQGSNFAVSGTCVQTALGATVPVYKIKEEIDCFDATDEPNIVCPSNRRYISWSGWWSQTAGQPHSWTVIKGSDICLCGGEVVIRFENDDRIVVPRPEFLQKVVACEDVTLQIKLLNMLQKLRPGDVIQTNHLTRTHCRSKNGAPKTFVVLSVPKGQTLTCTACCLLDVCARRPTPYSCGSSHTTSIDAEAITVQSCSGGSPQPCKPAIFMKDDFSVLSSDYCGNESDTQLHNYLGWYAYMIDDPCKKLWKVTKTLSCSKSMRLLRLTDYSDASHEYVVTWKQFNDKFWFYENIETTRSIIAERLSARDNLLQTLQPGDAVFATSFEGRRYVIEMYEDCDGCRLFKLGKNDRTVYEQWVKLDSGNTFIIEPINDVNSICYKRKANTELKLNVGDVVVMQRIKQLDNSKMLQASMYKISRLIEAGGGKAAVLCWPSRKRGGFKYRLDYRTAQMFPLLNGQRVNWCFGEDNRAKRLRLE